MKFSEIAKSKNKLLLVESIDLPEYKNVEIINSLVESEGKTYKAFAIVRGVPVSKYTENLNGRIYGKELWEKVYKSKIAEGTLCLADHPPDDSDGSVKDIVGVWRNFRLNEKNCVADLYLTSKFGKEFLEVLQAGGKNGLSSVGYGELMNDEKTVDPNSYELVRLADWVLYPSQEVYVKKENIDENSLSSVQEKVNHYYKEEKENNMETAIVPMKESINPMINKLTIRNNVKVSIKEAEKALKEKGTSLIEAKKDLAETLSLIPLEFEEDRTQLKKYIEKVDHATKKDIVTTKKESIEVLKENKTLGKKYKVSLNIANTLKQKFNEQKKTITILKKNSNLMRADIKSLLEDRKAMLKDINRFLESRKSSLKNIESLVEDRKIMGKDISTLMKERGVMLSDIKRLLKDKITMLEDISCFVKDKKAMKKDINILKRKLREEDGEIEQIYDTEELEQIQDENYGDEQYDIAVSPDMAVAAEDENMGLPSSNLNDTDEGDMLEYRRNKKFKKIKESATKRKLVEKKLKKPNRAYRDVKNYYESMVRKYPYLKEFRTKLLNQNSLVGIVNAIKKIQESRRDKLIKTNFKESTRFYDWVGDMDI